MTQTQKILEKHYGICTPAVLDNGELNPEVPHPAEYGWELIN